MTQEELFDLAQRISQSEKADELLKYMGDRLSFARGGSIHIKPENRGKFNALKERTGHSASWFKAHGTPAQKKMAVFELNARKWKHEDGGLLKLYTDGGDTNNDDYNAKLEIYKSSVDALEKAKKERDFADDAFFAAQDALPAKVQFSGDYAWYKIPEIKKLGEARDAANAAENKARQEYFRAGKELANATLLKYAGTSYDPMYFWNYVADTKDEAEKYYTDLAIRESAGAKEVADYFNSYANSPGYQRIRENQRQWWIDRHPYRKIWQMGTGTAMESTDWLQDKLAGLSPAGIFDISTYPELSVMRNGNGHGVITVGTFDNEEFPYWFTLPHEMAHISHIGGFATSSLSAQKEALEQNVNTEPGHDSEPVEKHSDKEALMFLLYKEGIYDSRSDKDCTPEDIAKLRKKYPNLRPLLQMDDERAAWMINHVADAGPQKSLRPEYDVDLSANLAANGGLIHIYDGNTEPTAQMQVSEPLFLDTPYQTAEDFIHGWYPQRTEQMRSNVRLANSKRNDVQSPTGKIMPVINKMIRDSDATERYIVVPDDYFIDENEQQNFTENNRYPLLQDQSATPQRLLTGNALMSLVHPTSSVVGYAIPRKNVAFYSGDKAEGLAENTFLHELTHNLMPAYHQGTGYGTGNSNPMEIAAADILSQVPNVDNLSDAEPYELVSRLNEARMLFGVNPKRTMTVDDIVALRKKAKELGKEKGINADLFDKYDDATLLRFFNEIAQSAPTAIDYNNLS